jgi:hypothetical protein
MKFALNYSPAAADLRRGGKIAIDLFKCPDWPEVTDPASEFGPIYVHFPLVVGTGAGDAINSEHQGIPNWGRIDDYLRQTGTPYLNVHMRCYADDHRDISANFGDDALAEKVVEIVLADLIPVVARYGAERVIVENYPYRSGSSVLRPLAYPEVISRIVRESGCGFLLDISHARISAAALGMRGRAYVRALPVDRIREIHVAGIHLHENRLRDHLDMRPADWRFLNWALAQIRAAEWAEPWVLAMEYGGIGDIFEWRTDPGVIAEQVPRMFHSINGLRE